MRNKTLVVFLLTFTLKAISQSVPDSASHSDSQTRIINYRKLQIGIVGIVNRFQPPGPPPENGRTYHKEFGGGVGIHLQYNVKRSLALTANVMYEQKNWTSNRAGYSGSEESNERFHAMTFPLLIKYSPFKRNFFISAGPYLGIILKNEVKGYQDGNYTYKSPFEVGAAVGLGFNIPVSNRISILMEGRNYINMATSRSLKSFTKMNTATFQLGAFYKFGKMAQAKVRKKSTDSVWAKQKKVFVKVFYGQQAAFRVREQTEVKKGKYHQYPENGGYSSAFFTYNASDEKPMTASEIGILIEFIASKHVNLTTGFSYDRQGYEVKERDFTVFRESKMGFSTTIYRDTTIIKNQSMTFLYEFLSKQLNLNYQLKKGKATYYGGLGLEWKILFNHKFRFSDEDAENAKLIQNSQFDDKRYKYLEASTLFYSINIGVAIPIYKKLQIFFEPNFKMQTEHFDYSPKLWSAGCKVGLKF